MSFFFSSNIPKAQKPFSVAIVRSEFNADLTERLLDETIKGLRKCDINENAIEVFDVPGALEIPFAAQKIMQTGDFDGIIALGVVIRGETYHFELVANESTRGITELNLEGSIPIICGILTTENEAQALARIPKGFEFAKSLVQMMNLSLTLLNDPTENKKDDS